MVIVNIEEEENVACIVAKKVVWKTITPVKGLDIKIETILEDVDLTPGK